MTMHTRNFSGPNTTGVRSLAALAKSCSTSRVLNLNSVDQTLLEDEEKIHLPFFQDRLLNCAIITKHRPRPDELEYFHESVPIATKVIFPLDNKDLRLGGRSIFVNQIGYLNSICDFLGKDHMDLYHDLTVLELLNDLPSLDPFLVREQLKRHNFTPSDDYFAFSPSDTARLEKFTYNEIRELVSLAFKSGAEGGGELVKRMSNAILATNADHRLAPLQSTLGLEGEQFQRGIFSWKGFLYYKWQFQETKSELYKVVAQMQALKIRGRTDATIAYAVATIRGSIKARIHETIWRTSDILSLYDDGIAGLTKNDNAAHFRRFLLEAPGLFIELGHAMGMISHIVSYWQYKFRPNQTEVTNAEEFLDLLRDFDLGLSPRETQ